MPGRYIAVGLYSVISLLAFIQGWPLREVPLYYDLLVFERVCPS